MNSKGVLAPTREQIADLIRPREGIVVSLLLPPAPPDEGRIALRNLAKDAAAVLESAGMRSADVKAQLEPVDAVVEDHDLWARPEASIAIYLADGWSTTMPGPRFGSPLSLVGGRFQAKHLLDAVPEPRFAVVALSRKTSRLFTGDAVHFDEVARAGFPMAMDEVLRYDDREPQLQSHGSARRGGGTVVASFHGQGGRREQGEDLLRYLRAVSTAMETVLTGQYLVPAGTDELVAAFRRTTSYAHVVSGEITGSGERLGAVELAEGARPLVDAAVTAHRTSAMARLVELSGTDAAALDLGAMVTAAIDGRVATMFVAGDAEVWGRYDATTRRVVDADAGQGAEDLLNLAAIETWGHGGEVFVLPETDVPGPWPAAALLRY